MTKNPLKSNTVHGIVVTLAGALLDKYVADPETYQSIIAHTMELIGLLIALYGRWKADKKLTLSGGPANAALLLLPLLLVACATSDQPTEATLGEGNKDMSMSLFDSVATTRETAKLKDGTEGRGGEYTRPVTEVVEVDEPYLIPIVDVDGNPILDADGNPQTELVTRKVKKVLPVLGPDGEPLYEKVTGFRNFIQNWGTISPSMTSSGESSGTQTQTPTSSPTNEPSTPVNLTR